MHVNIKFKVKNDCVSLPISYNHLVQSCIYNSISDELADFLHSTGYCVEKRNFKLFSFSRLNGPFQIDKDKKEICFFEKIGLTVSSLVDEFCESLVNTLLTKGEVRIGSNVLEVESINAKKIKIDQPEIKVKTLSPIVVYSTLLGPDGRKYTCYFQPGDPDFESLIDNNLKKKYYALHSEQFSQGSIKLRSLGRCKLNIINYKNFVIKGYSGRLALSGPKDLLQIAVDGALGSKNSQGFGCIDLL
ncbi:MAG TPA: CRISPR-associated endoribonuclease Cas6 [Clostridiales bacterium]|nr:CRISPR-associated endoribonuclease Cas6 [Clostridiales bacterium]